MIVGVEVLASARKHGVSDDDIRHAVSNAIAAIRSPRRPDFIMVIGPSQGAELLEIGVLETDDGEFVIHAMAARSRYLDMIPPQK